MFIQNTSSTHHTMLCCNVGDCDVNFHHYENFIPKNISLVIKSHLVLFRQCNDSDNLNHF